MGTLINESSLRLSWGHEWMSPMTMLPLGLEAPKLGGKDRGQRQGIQIWLSRILTYFDHDIVTLCLNYFGWPLMFWPKEARRSLVPFRYFWRRCSDQNWPKHRSSIQIHSASQWPHCPKTHCPKIPCIGDIAEPIQGVERLPACSYTMSIGPTHRSNNWIGAKKGVGVRRRSLCCGPGRWTLLTVSARRASAIMSLYLRSSSVVTSRQARVPCSKLFPVSHSLSKATFRRAFRPN